MNFLQPTLAIVHLSECHTTEDITIKEIVYTNRCLE